MLFFKANNHVMKDDATHHWVGMELKVVIILQWVLKLLQRLETALKSSKCVFYRAPSVAWPYRVGQPTLTMLLRSWANPPWAHIRLSSHSNRWAGECIVPYSQGWAHSGLASEFWSGPKGARINTQLYWRVSLQQNGEVSPYPFRVGPWSIMVGECMLEKWVSKGIAGILCWWWSISIGEKNGLVKV